MAARHVILKAVPGRLKRMAVAFRFIDIIVYF
jgi:hypothetical protein